MLLAIFRYYNKEITGHYLFILPEMLDLAFYRIYVIINIC